MTAIALDLRLGRWQDVLHDITCESWISDPPYGERTHESEAGERSDGHSSEGLAPQYAHLTPADVHEIVASWSPRVRDWMVGLTSHDLVPHWEAAYEEAGRYCFAPIPCVMRGMSFRKQGDGPSSWTAYAVVARPREKRFIGSGCRDGAYVGAAGREAGGGRGKPMWLMNALVRDYSAPGARICDPFAGWGTTAAAALGLGRQFVGAEMDADAHREAHRRLGRGVQIDLLEGIAPTRSTTQRIRRRRANGEAKL